MDYYDGLFKYGEYTLQQCFRHILGSPYMTLSVSTHEFLDMEILKIRRFKHTCIVTYKILNCTCLSRLKNGFEYVKDVSTRATRSSHMNNLYI